MFFCSIATFHDFLLVFEIFKVNAVLFSLTQLQLKCLLKGYKQKI